MVSLRDERQLRELPAQVLIASVDPLERGKAFAATLGLPFPVLSDRMGHTAARYGMLDAGGLARRQTLIIGTDGRIRHIFEKVEVRTHGADLLKVLADLLPTRGSPDGGGSRDAASCPLRQEGEPEAATPEGRLRAGCPVTQEG